MHLFYSTPAKKNRKCAHLLQKNYITLSIINADGWKVVIREVEDTLFFSSVVTFLFSIDADNWVLES